MARNCASPIMFLVCGVSGTWRLTTSDWASKLVERLAWLGVAVAQLVDHVEIDHPHAHGFGERGQLGADIAVADDAERLAAHFHAVGGALVPAALMGVDRARENAAHQHDDFADRQLRHRAGVGEGRVEDRDAADARGGQRDLVGADAEAADRDQPVGGLEHFFPELGARADADHVHALQSLAQLRAVQRLGQTGDVLVAGGAEKLDGGLMNALQQQNLDLVLGQGQFCGHHWLLGCRRRAKGQNVLTIQNVLAFSGIGCGRRSRRGWRSDSVRFHRRRPDRTGGR